MDQPGGWRTVAQGFTPLLAALGLLWAAAGAWEQLQDHAKRIDQLEAQERSAALADRAAAERLARIEEKLAFLVEQQRERRP